MKDYNNVYLTALAYELGELQSITEIDELKNNPELLNTFLTVGLEKYSNTNSKTLEMAKKSASVTIDKANLSPKDIDLLIYATYSFWDFQSPGYVEIAHLINELGLKNAYPIGTFLSGCANLQTAIRLGTNLIRTEGYKNVLIITADRISEQQSRIVQPNISILSDASASCILTNDESKSEFEVICTSQNTDPGIMRLDFDKQSLEYFSKTIEGTKNAVKKALTSIQKEPNNFSKLITNNYNLSVTKSIGASLKFNFDQIYTKNISRFAHANAADNLINLHDFSKEKSLLTNDLILLLGSGPSTWGCIILAKS